MKFTYLLNQKRLLDSIDLPLEKSGIFLLTGIESSNLSILTGILGKLFPIPKEEIEWGAIAALVQNYTGDLIILEGKFPDIVSYVGPDPDRHILFSTVEEEMMISLSLSNDSKENIEKYLAVFGLDPSFVTRNIATLSGGERMKVVLAIVFAKKSDSYILHGILPWLDDKGRKLLFNKVLQLKSEGINFIFCEHEIEGLFSIVDEVYKFDSNTVVKIDKENFINNYWIEQKSACVSFDFQSNILIQKKIILEFNKISLKQHPNFDGDVEKILLNDVSFLLQQGQSYFFIGDNGVGKSTIAELIFRIFLPDSGQIFFDEKILKNYSRAELAAFICYLSQFPEQQITFNTVGEYKKEALSKKNDLGLFLLNKYLQLDNDFPVAALSFLDLKLLNLAFFINAKTKLIILDEPTWGLDQSSQKVILDLLHEVKKQVDITMLIISHNESLIRSLNGVVFKIEKGNILLQHNYL